MRILMLNFIALLMAASAFAAKPYAIALPAPEQLMTMSLKERLDFYRGIASLPDEERDTTLNALRNEINGMTPTQKQQMQAHFQSEYAALSPAQQEQVKGELQAMGR
jgi:hypothetical protein